MNDASYSLYQLIQEDSRYPIEAYLFVREALAYACDTLQLGCQTYDEETGYAPQEDEQHLTGQELCEAIRQYANNQFGYMAKVVLKTWGIDRTECFGDIVYNMIRLGLMKKSSHDKRSHFDNVYQFDDVFQKELELGHSLAQRRC